MMHATVSDVAAWCGATYEEAAGDAMLAGVSTDTRTLQPGQLFVPLTGTRDGHDFFEAALKAGAAASLWARSRPLPARTNGIPLLLVDDPLIALQRLAAGYLAATGAIVVAVTGSNGKTSTKDMICAVLSARYRVHKTDGNYNNEIGLPLTVLGAAPDTEVLVLEMGMSERGEISLLTRLARPDIAVITNVGEAHLLQLGSRRNIARAKLEIVEGLKQGGTLVMNGDEPLLAEELDRSALPPDARVVTFGESAACDYVVRDVTLSVAQTSFTVSAGTAAHPEANAGANPVPTTIEIPVPGKHNALNALAAVIVGNRLGLTPDQIADGLRRLKLTRMRVESLRAACGAIVLNDAYNANPTSMRAAIELVGACSGFRARRLVLGDMLELGPDERRLHRDVGQWLKPSLAEYVYAYGPLSSEIAEAAKSAYPPGAVRHYTDKDKLIAALIRDIGPEDLVLLKASRGMQLEEVAEALQRGGVG